MVTDYFQLFGLPRQFEVDLNLLNQRYFELQKQYHPDIAKDNGVKSAEVNQAYNTLKNRMKRAEYMAGKDLKACPALLLEIMELRENGDVEGAKLEIESLFKQFAITNDEDKKNIFVRIKYLTKFVEDATSDT